MSVIYLFVYITFLILLFKINNKFYKILWITIKCKTSYIYIIEIISKMKFFLINKRFLKSARPKKNVQDMVTSANTSPERMGRTRNRVSGVSQSQRKFFFFYK